MSQKKVHSQKLVRFAWENKPGVCKVRPGDDNSTKEERHAGKLPPPPCGLDKGRVAILHDLQIPLPPCPFQSTPHRSSVSKNDGKEYVEDPFLVAYMACTKSIDMTNDNGMATSKRETRTVRDDSLVKMSQVRIMKEKLGYRKKK
ncbi:hypothetical protein RJ641_029280 [Dillenia turbinata]|uniref:Uncharacterized protein n=1 Tax=Dillenia turbinata TaxID=194707 RepID=A0AAN8ZG50_9MAGN